MMFKAFYWYLGSLQWAGFDTLEEAEWWLNAGEDAGNMHANRIEKDNAVIKQWDPNPMRHDPY